MAMVISGRAKAVIGALVCFFLLGVVLVTGSTKGWFNGQDYNGERAAARIQVLNLNSGYTVVELCYGRSIMPLQPNIYVIFFAL